MRTNVDFKKYSIFMFLEEYNPTKKNLLQNVGDAVIAREYYYKQKPTNLVFLLQKRYDWMNKFIKANDSVLEVGCGMGVAKDFIRKDIHLIITDIESNPWVDQVVDACETKFPDNSFDVVFCSNMVHHLAIPQKFFKEMGRILKPGGYLLIQEIDCSLMCRLILRLCRHEGWSFKTDPFNSNESCNKKDDPWSGNNAIPNLLFDNPQKFEQNFPFFKVQDQKFSEFLIFPLSGGVTAKIKTLSLPVSILKIIDEIDNFLVSLWPGIFALQRRIILIKS